MNGEARIAADLNIEAGVLLERAGRVIRAHVALTGDAPPALDPWLVRHLRERVTPGVDREVVVRDVAPPPSPEPPPPPPPPAAAEPDPDPEPQQPDPDAEAEHRLVTDPAETRDIVRDELAKGPATVGALIRAIGYQDSSDRSRRNVLQALTDLGAEDSGKRYKGGILWALPSEPDEEEAGSGDPPSGPSPEDEPAQGEGPSSPPSAAEPVEVPGLLPPHSVPVVPGQQPPQGRVVGGPDENGLVTVELDPTAEALLADDRARAMLDVAPTAPASSPVEDAEDALAGWMDEQQAIAAIESEVQDDPNDAQDLEEPAAEPPPVSRRVRREMEREAKAKVTPAGPPVPPSSDVREDARRREIAVQILSACAREPMTIPKLAGELYRSRSDVGLLAAYLDKVGWLEHGPDGYTAVPEGQRPNA